MLQFWLAVFLKAFWDSLDFIGESKGSLTFATLVLVLTAMLLSARHEWKTAIKRWWRTVGEGVAIAIVAFTFIFIVHFIFEPHHLLRDMEARRDNLKVALDAKVLDLDHCASDVRVEQAKTELMQSQLTNQQGVINSQQGTIDSQQSNVTSIQDTLAHSQAAVTTCVGDLAKAIIPEPQRTVMTSFPDDPDKAPITKHARALLLLTNKPVTPVRLNVWCDHDIFNLTMEPLTGSAYSGTATPAPDRKSWFVGLQFPTWTYENPLLVKVFYNEEDLGNCYSRPL